MDILHFLCFAYISTSCHQVSKIRTLNVYLCLWCQITRKYIYFLLSSPWTVVTHFLTLCIYIMLNIEPQIEMIVLNLYKTIQQMKRSKLILINLTLMLNVVCFYSNHYYACPISMECCYAIIAYLYMKLYFHVGRISRYLSLYLFITTLNLAK